MKNNQQNNNKFLKLKRKMSKQIKNKCTNKLILKTNKNLKNKFLKTRGINSNTAS